MWEMESLNKMQINEKAPFRENECYEDSTAQGALERGRGGYFRAIRKLLWGGDICWDVNGEKEPVRQREQQLQRARGMNEFGVFEELSEEESKSGRGRRCSEWGREEAAYVEPSSLRKEFELCFN